MSPDYLVLTAGAIYMLALLIINQVALRLMLLLGSAFYVWYYYVAVGEPLWAAIVTNLGISSANLVGLLMLWLRNSRFAIPKQHADIYPMFSVLPPGDFRALMALSKRTVVSDELVMTRENAPVDTLYFVLSGQVMAQKRGESFALAAGIFIGEVAYLSGKGASATTKLAPGGEVLEWDVAALRSKARRRPRFNLALDALISMDLAAKVAQAGAPGAASADPRFSEPALV
ncbi:cyclic nucleotide-binding domain-containing protein [Oricola sp.]|uniref:cyclic nucleotide-binding domain-containing protein n=1 Tax=Oricola sp. TaxID=1979950 RepID=UPI0025FCF49F|nr:cyclic nucleotide-binding domain-containing protein [Oricola sp.]MCI5078457.1 cyclic nucleotide-binding domain-containing protein [Oricola sp.]